MKDFIKWREINHSDNYNVNDKMDWILTMKLTDDENNDYDEDNNNPC